MNKIVCNNVNAKYLRRKTESEKKHQCKYCDYFNDLYKDCAFHNREKVTEDFWCSGYSRY